MIYMKSWNFVEEVELFFKEMQFWETSKLES
jgi:hypothetical protein